MIDSPGANYVDSSELANAARRDFGERFNSVVAGCLYGRGLYISDAALAIAHSGVRGIVNFNFDDILEEIYQTECIPHEVVLNGGKFNLSNDRITIFHPHGYLGRFDNDEEYQENKIILSRSDYEELYLDHYCLTNLIQLSMLMTKTVLFVGMSMRDPNINRLLSKAREVGVENWHYALIKSGSDSYMKKWTRKLRAIGVLPIWFKEYTDIPRIIKVISV
ncbi:hypothetical protein C8233_04840 [Halomonas sp. SF2003]|nr:hypothetical protein C8233_04840 [Halomonas sp. SF2003]